MLITMFYCTDLISSASYTQMCACASPPLHKPTNSKADAVWIRFAKAGLRLMLTPLWYTKAESRSWSESCAQTRVYPHCQTTKLVMFFQRCCHGMAPASLLHAFGYCHVFLFLSVYIHIKFLKTCWRICTGLLEHAKPKLLK